MRILVADDEPMGAMMLSRSLQRWGLDVVVARDGEEAWRIIDRDGGISMAILDWMKPASATPADLPSRNRTDKIAS